MLVEKDLLDLPVKPIKQTPEARVEEVVDGTMIEKVRNDIDTELFINVPVLPVAEVEHA